MDWVLRSPQIHSSFCNLGFIQADGYHINNNCNSALETILENILSEDKYLRTYRRSISFGQNIKRDIIPLLIHAKEDKTIELIIRILVNLTIPIECLLNVDLISKTDYGRYAIFEINNLLASTKVAFTELQTSKALVNFMKKNVNVEQKDKLSEEQRTNVSNCLLLLRNILHIPEDNIHMSTRYNGSMHSIQNQILWNIFSQSIDKIIIKAMTILDARFWGVTMVQLVALLYKDQHVVSLHKLLNNWLEVSLSESSEDNESNTSPPDRAGSEDSSPMLTSDPTSDSSDNGISEKCGASIIFEHAAVQNDQDQTFMKLESMDDDKSVTSLPDEQYINTGDDKSSKTMNDDEMNSNIDILRSCLAAPDDEGDQNEKQKHTVIISETSDCGYGTHIDNVESISTSSNEDDWPAKKPVHQKPHNPKHRPNNKPRSCGLTQDRKRKKIIKRGKANIINVQGLSHKTPTDDDISNVLKEFTVDFLLKGYNSLVHTLHNEILTNPQLQIDTSHFFWLVTYFLKFATQIELDLEHVESVLSFEIVSYLTSEGVNLCEQFELSIKLDGHDLSPYIRRQHLVVTAIREFVQAVELYKKMPHLEEEARNKLRKLQIKMCETEELRSTLVLLLRHYNPKYHSKQYLQDLVVTNHILLIFLDNVMKLPDYNCPTKMLDHIRQFATIEMMAKYGLLLGDYLINGEFVNDCIFTIMHHVGGEAGSLITLFQPNILKTFNALWKSDFELCDDWSDLIEYVINTFVTKPNSLSHAHLIPEIPDDFNENKIMTRTIEVMSSHSKDIHDDEKKEAIKNNAIETTFERWTDDEVSALNWNYLQNNAHTDVIEKITKQLKEDGIVKSRESVTRELFKQNLISKDFYERQMKEKCERNTKAVQLNKENREEEIAKFCEHLRLDGESIHLEWLQKVLLEICYAKIHLQKKNRIKTASYEPTSKLLNFEIFKPKNEDMPVVSPVAYHSLILQQSVPLVPWNCPQARICKDLKFLQLLHKLGFQMPVDTGKVFIRIPHFWTPDILFDVAGKIRPIDMTNLKFSMNELSDNKMYNPKADSKILVSSLVQEVPLVQTVEFYQIHKQRLATMVNFTPRPCPSFKSGTETAELNWLQIVQKSQERKIILNMQNVTKTTENIVMQSPVESVKVSVKLELKAPAVPPVSAANAPARPRAPIARNPAQESSHDTAQLADSDHHYSSAFETASVASDLTHMYVSDEDEKPENILISPILDPKMSTNLKDQTVRDQRKITGKRRREH